MSRTALCDNRLLGKPLQPVHVKSMLLGNWGATPGQNVIYVHLNRVIQEPEELVFWNAETCALEGPLTDL